MAAMRSWPPMRALALAWVAALLAGCALLGGHNPKEVAALMPMIDKVEYSRLDDAGVKQIEASQIAKFDLRTGTTTLDALGLTARQLGPAIGGPSDPDLVLVLDGPKGRDVVVTRTMMFAVIGKVYLNSLTFWRQADTLDEAIDELRQGITRWGYRQQDVHGWAEGVSQQPGKEDKAVVAYGVSPSSGLVTSVEVNYKPDKPIVLQYTVYTTKSVYDPRNLEAIRTTGQMDWKLTAETAGDLE